MTAKCNLNNQTGSNPQGQGHHSGVRSGIHLKWISLVTQINLGCLNLYGQKVILMKCMTEMYMVRLVIILIKKVLECLVKIELMKLLLVE